MTTAVIKDLTSIVRSAPVVSVSNTCRETLRVMFQHPQSKCIIVCNTENEPLGLLMSERFLLKATGRQGMEMSYREPVVNFMNRTPLITDSSTPLEILRTEASSRPEAFNKDCIIVTRNGKFAGVAYSSDLLQ